MDEVMVAIGRAFGWMAVVMTVLLAIGLVVIGAVTLVKGRHAT